MHQGERDRRRSEGLVGKVREYGRILAGAEQKHRSFTFGGHFSYHEHRVGLQDVKVPETLVALNRREP
jgi:hypothetical protein